MTTQGSLLPTDGPAVLAQVVRLATERSLDMLPAARYQHQRNTLLRTWAATWPGLPAAELRAQVRLLDPHHILTPEERAAVFLIHYRLNAGAERPADPATDVFPPAQWVRAVFPLDELDQLDQEWLATRQAVRRQRRGSPHPPPPGVIRSLWWATGGGVVLVLFGLVLGACGGVVVGVGTMLAVLSGVSAWFYQQRATMDAEAEQQYRFRRMMLQKRAQGVPPPPSGPANEPPAGDPG